MISQRDPLVFVKAGCSDLPAIIFIFIAMQFEMPQKICGHPRNICVGEGVGGR